MLVDQRCRQDAIGALDLLHLRDHLRGAVGFQRDDQLAVGAHRMDDGLRQGRQRGRQRGGAARCRIDDQARDVKFGGVHAQLPGGPAKSW